jgi:hypothetical protein
MAKLVWTEEGDGKIVESVKELDKILDRLTADAEQGKPFIVELVADNGNVMGIGIGRPQSVLGFMEASFQPPYYASRNREFSNADDEVIVFYYGGHWTEFPIKSAIPIQDAREAFRRFFVTGALPDNIEWEEV